MPRKVTPDTPEAPKRPRISVLERRLQNPFGEVATEIEFKDPGRTAHWFNRAIASDKVWRAKNNGWSLTYERDLVDPEQVGGYVKDAGDGHITRGERGQEVLMWMPESDYKQIQWAKTRVNLEKMKDYDGQKRDIVNAASAHIGDEAADFLNRRIGPVGGVRDNIEVVERLPEA